MLRQLARETMATATAVWIGLIIGTFIYVGTATVLALTGFREDLSTPTAFWLMVFALIAWYLHAFVGSRIALLNTRRFREWISRGVRAFHFLFSTQSFIKLSHSTPVLFLFVLFGVFLDVTVVLSSFTGASNNDWLIPMGLLSAYVIVVLSSVVYLRGQRPKWFHLSKSEELTGQLETRVIGLLERIHAEEDLARILSALLRENQWVAGEALWRRLNHPSKEIRERTNEFVRFLEDDISLRRAVSPILNYTSERKDFEDWNNLIEKNFEEIETGWQQIEKEHYVTFGLKRVLDIVISLGVIFVFAPMFILLILVLRLQARNAPSLFVTRRLGKHGTPFSYIRLNAMSVDPRSGVKYLGKIGLFLLSTGIDRLPTFVNVLWGEMSVVGPHPLYLSQLDRLRNDLEKMRKLEPDEAKKYVVKRMAVKPGLTGPAQVKAISEVGGLRCIDYLDLDVDYVDNLSFRRDVEILVKTFLIGMWFFLTNPLIPFTVSSLSPRNALRTQEAVNGIFLGEERAIAGYLRRTRPSHYPS